MKNQFNSNLFLCPQWPNRKWTFTSLWNVEITVDDGEIKLFESNQKPDHKTLHICRLTVRRPWIIRGRERIEKKRWNCSNSSWHTYETFWRLWNGSRPGPDLSRNRASGVARVKTCIWTMETAERLLHQKHVPACNPKLFSQQWIRRVSSRQTQFIDIGFHVSLWKKPVTPVVTPLKLNIEQRQLVGLLVVSAALETKTVTSLKSLHFKPPVWNINTRFAVTCLL